LRRDTRCRRLSWQHGKCNLVGSATTVSGEELTAAPAER
jgi:hypothetical protein